eukprot:TRINITY_DN8158_c0_g1_i1.p1 TRINITY_DN8158_c0_g1~~TRINITY_DN8158_c0_g1_i1.p1  ORF type:complete len:604 (-),score=320.70 TRINITY_DN8158_c0_g1_i1:112-1923(-)
MDKEIPPPSSVPIEERLNALEDENRNLKSELTLLKQLLRDVQIVPKVTVTHSGSGSDSQAVVGVANGASSISRNQSYSSLSEGEGASNIYSSDEETVHRSGLRLVPRFEEDKCVEIIAQVVDDINKTQKKKKNKKKKKNPTQIAKQNQRKKLRKPVVHAALEIDDFFLSNIDGDLQSMARELKLKALNAVRRHTPVELISEVTSVESLLSREYQKGDYSTFYLVNLGSVVEKYVQWVKYLPRVQPFYAMKSNPDINLVRVLQTLGAGFDCASKLELVEAIEVGAQPKDIIYANPCKGPEHIRYAREKGIEMMTFDSIVELDKIHSIYPESKVVLRILPDDRNSLMPFGVKFGASFEDCKILIKRCKEIGLALVGVSFHVGSGCFSSKSYVDAVLLARSVFDLAEQEGFKLSLLDIGGGWPGGSEELTFPDIAKDLAPVLEQHFSADVRIIAEPGRYFCTTCYTLAVSIISRKERAAKPKLDAEGKDIPAVGLDQKEVLYYLSDGLYGSFNNIVFDHAHPTPVPLRKDSQADGTSTPMRRCSLFGPTCDSIDVICKDIELPELQVGDWLYFMDMGAYTLASASSFNGFKPPNAKYLMYTGGESL